MTKTISKIESFLPADHYSLIYSWLNLSEINTLKQVSTFFKKTTENFLDKSTPHQNTQKILNTFMLRYYLACLPTDFPTLNDTQPRSLPYLNENALSLPPKFSFFHRFFDWLSTYPTDSEIFTDFAPGSSQIDHLRRCTKRIHTTIESLDMLQPDPQKLRILSNRLFLYKKHLSEILGENAKVSSRSHYFQNITFRRYALMSILGMILKFSAKDLFVNDGNHLGTLRALAFLSLLFKMLDQALVSNCKKHLKRYYPGLRLDNHFLENRLALFDGFLKEAVTEEDILGILTQQFSPEASTLLEKIVGAELKAKAEAEAAAKAEANAKAAAEAQAAAEAAAIAPVSAAVSRITTAVTRRVAATIAPAANPEPPHKPLNLFFYYQHHHHPHAFKSDAEKNESKKRSVDSIDKIYAYFCQDEEREKIKTRRFGL